MRKKSLVPYFLGVIILLGACSGYEKLLKGTDYELKYSEAKRFYEEEEFYKAQVLYDQIAPIYRGTEQADTIYYYQAMSYFMQKDYIVAGHYFTNFARTYGGSPFAEKADYMSAYCYYKNSPRAELDQDNSMLAIQMFQLYLVRHGDSDLAEDAKKYIDELKEKLVEKSFISAKLYFDLEAYKASMVALNNSLVEYPESKYREDIMFMILKSSYMYAENSIEIKKKERFQTALDDYYSFKAEFPESEYMKEVGKYFKSSAAYLGVSIENKEIKETEIN